MPESTGNRLFVYGLLLSPAVRNFLLRGLWDFLRQLPRPMQTFERR